MSRSVMKLSNKSREEYEVRPIFDPNNQLVEIWVEDLQPTVEYELCLRRFVKTINDKTNYNLQGYVKFLAKSKKDINLENGTIINKDRLEMFVMQFPAVTLTNKWTLHCPNADTNFKNEDNLLLTIKKTSRKRILKLSIKNIGEETEW